jgi:hypothetical protein
MCFRMSIFLHILVRAIHTLINVLGWYRFDRKDSEYGTPVPKHKGVNISHKF